MSRVRVVSLTLLAVLVAGCSGSTTVADPAGDPSSPTGSSTGASTGSSTGPAEPGGGTYPAYQPESYAYTLRINCFCIDAGVPIRITVVAGEVTTAIYGEDGRGVEKGASADESRRVTINDLIDRANDPSAASVVVDWPDGQDHPSRISIDGSEMVADDEASYELSAVVPAS